MDAVISSIEVVVPIYFMIAIGYAANRFGIFSRDTLKEMNQSVFRLFLPMLLFENMYQSEVSVADGGLIVYAAACAICIYLVCCVSAFRFISDRARAATVAQGMYRSNFALLGIALTATMYGSDNTGVTGMLVAVIVPFYNVLAVILFEVSKGTRKPDLSKIFVGVLKNPLIIGTALGLLCNITGMQIPQMVNSAVISLGQIATPLALIVMGGNFELRQTIHNGKALMTVTTVRLVLVPLVFTIVSVLLGFRQKELYALFLMFATPTAVASYAMACAMGGDEDMAGEIVLVTTVLSLFTIGTGVFALKTLSFI